MYTFNHYFRLTAMGGGYSISHSCKFAIEHKSKGAKVKSQMKDSENVKGFTGEMTKERCRVVVPRRDKQQIEARSIVQADKSSHIYAASELQSKDMYNWSCGSANNVVGPLMSCNCVNQSSRITHIKHFTQHVSCQNWLELA